MSGTVAPTRALTGPVDGWLDELRRGRRLSDRTLDAYGRDLADYTAFARRHSLASWAEATVTFVDGYFASLQRRGLASGTVSRRRSTLRGFHGSRVSTPTMQLARSSCSPTTMKSVP